MKSPETSTFGGIPMAGDLTPKKYEELTKREVEQAPLVELKGFDRDEFREKQEKKYQNLSEPERRELIDKEENENIILDTEQMKVFLKDLNERLGGNGFKNFLEKFCTIELNTDKQEWEGGVTLKPNAGQKISIEIDPLSFLEYGQTFYINEQGKKVYMKRFNPAKAALLIGRAVGALLEEPKDWNKVSSKITVLEGNVGSWEDFVGYCVALPNQAKTSFPEGYQYFQKMLTELSSDPGNIKLRKLDKTSRLEEKNFALDLRNEDEKFNKFFQGMDNDYSFHKRFIESLKDLKNIPEDIKKNGLLPTLWQYSPLAPLWKKTFWYQRAVAEFEDKESNRIILQNEGVVDRDRELEQLVGDGTKNISWENAFQLRTLLLADMKCSDFALWRIDIYLQACDSLYRDTHGEQITEESYNFITRLHRNSQKAKRFGTKVCEYQLVEPGGEYKTYVNGEYVTKEAPKNQRIFIRKERDKFLNGYLEEIKTFSPRQILNIEKEITEYMKINGKFIDPIKDKYSTLAEAENRYAIPTGYLDKFTNPKFAKNFVENICYRGEMSKFEPDQIAYLARVIAEEVKKRYKEGLTILQSAGKKVTFLYGAEHAPSHVIEAFENYKTLYVKNPTYRGYVNYYLGFSKLKIDENANVIPINGDEDSDAHDLKEFFDDKKNNNDKEIQEEAGAQASAANIAKEYDNIPDVDIKSTLIEKGTKNAANEVNTLEKAFQIYNKDIAKIIENSSLDINTKKLVSDIIMSSPNDYLLNVLINQYNEIFKKEANWETSRKIQDLENAVRPLRIAQRDIGDLLNIIGINPYLKKVRSVSTNEIKSKLETSKSEKHKDTGAKQNKDEIKKDILDETQKKLHKLSYQSIEQELLYKNIENELGNWVPENELKLIALGNEGKIDKAKAKEIYALLDIALEAEKLILAPQKQKGQKKDEKPEEVIEEEISPE